MTKDKYTKPKGSFISHMSDKVKQYGGINLAQGLPGFEPPSELMLQFETTINKNIHQYAPGNGNLKLLDLIRAKYQEYIKLSIDDILIVQGATEAMSLLFIYASKVFGKNFSSVALDPVYESYRNLPEIFNSNFIPLKLKAEEIDFEEFEHLLKRENIKIFFLGSPGNPYGKIISRNDINRIVGLAEKYDFFIFFDAVYKDLYFNKSPYQPLDELHKNIFYINSFSKSLSITGWRIGYLFAHPVHMSKIKAIHDYTGLCASSVLQEVLSQYLEKYNFGKDYTNSIKEQLKLNYSQALPLLLNLGFEIPKIEGGYFIWTKLPRKFEDAYRFAVDLYDDEQVAIIPGEHFSIDSVNYIRINLARKKEELDLGLKKIVHFIKTAK